MSNNATKTVDEHLGTLTSVRVDGVWAGLPDVLVDSYGNVRDQPAYLGMTISWAANGIGFGELTFRFSGERVSCDSETMSSEFVEAVLIKLARETELTHLTEIPDGEDESA